MRTGANRWGREPPRELDITAVMPAVDSPAKAPAPLRPPAPPASSHASGPASPSPLRVQDLAIADVPCCQTLTLLSEAARQLAAHGCEALPVLEPGSGRPLGVITHRDIVVRALATGRDVQRRRVVSAMTEPAVTIRADATIDEAAEVMEAHRVWHLVVVGPTEACAGVLTVADLVPRLPPTRAGRLLHEVLARQQPGAPGSSAPPPPRESA